MASDTVMLRSRRSVLTGMIGGLAGAAAATLIGAQRVLAAGSDGSPVLVGGVYGDAQLPTRFDNVTNDYDVIHAFSDLGDALAGESFRANGVHGISDYFNGSGVYGENTGNGCGVTGRTNATSVPGPLAAAHLADRPVPIPGAGLFGDDTADGLGVWARSAHGVALHAEAVNRDAVAIRADGVAQFRRSGKLTVKAGTSSVTRTGLRVDAGTLVLATLQQNRPGVFVRSAVPNATGDSFTIRLNKVVASDTTVGWFLVN
jgi:hypothetical protein